MIFTMALLYSMVKLFDKQLRRQVPVSIMRISAYLMGVMIKSE